MTTKLLEYADSEISSLDEVSLSALGRVDLSKESTVMKVFFKILYPILVIILSIPIVSVYSKNTLIFARSKLTILLDHEPCLAFMHQYNI